MTFQTTIQPNGYHFPIEEQETILEAALRHGYTLPYSCREGACGVCKGKVMEGQVDHGNHLGSALTDMDKAAGMTLFCCARPKSDLVIECQTAGKISDIPVRILPCRVRKMTRLADDVMALQLELPMGERLRFAAGQYISLLPKDQKPRNFSLANAPHNGEFLELHIRKVEGGAFTQYVFNEMKERDILRFKGPLGEFRLREGSDKPVIFVADGTGFAPVKAIIEYALHIGLQRPMHFYWGGRRPADLYMLEEARQWESSGIKFTPVLSAALPEDHWEGRAGLVHQAVLDDFSDLSAHEIYACGTPAMVDAARRDFTAQRGLPDESFLSNAFAPTPEFNSPFQAYKSPF
ncbi:MAG: CDP-6-deoxy-delta-3,4-glucoseen reductase [Gallionellales bacterium RIFCSPLOWO2_02_60_31]|nr:MAG: CDP-6-deoxy-delta-3,4-glucoseen reductase [Gallionellales bacterium RIFCSPLOWO2_02_60_31]